jgi:hypothetical protein
MVPSLPCVIVGVITVGKCTEGGDCGVKDNHRWEVWGKLLSVGLLYCSEDWGDHLGENIECGTTTAPRMGGYHLEEIIEFCQLLLGGLGRNIIWGRLLSLVNYCSEDWGGISSGGDY